MSSALAGAARSPAQSRATSQQSSRDFAAADEKSHTTSPATDQRAGSVGGKAAEPTSRTDLMDAPPAPDEWAAPRRPSGCSATEAGQTQGAAGHGMMCAVPYLGGGVGVDQGQFDDAGPTSGHREGPAGRRSADFLGGAHERERVRQHVTRSREQVRTGREQCGAQRRNRPGHPT